MAGVDEPRDQRDHLGDVVGRLRHDLRPQDVELLAVDEELVRVALGEHERIDVLAPRGDGHLVLAADVRVAHQVPDVGDVHHLLHLVAEVLEGAARDIRGEIRVQVADVLVVVDGRAAVVHGEAAGPQRREVTHRARGAVVQADRGDRGNGDVYLSLFEVRDRESGDGLGGPDDPEAIMCRRLHAHAVGGSAERAGDRFTHRLHMRCEAGLLGDDRRVQ